ncbi:hypothetical protein CKO10_03215 [Rhodospirillum rubrum]|uniref:YgjV family protein n=1 Tax=Rhodospirillum rubrum TaxID=1085 RepID=UPI001903C202|nr:hypothetical protein [Rhodospirillum rubrum]
MSYFLLSQIFVTIAILFDFLSLQYKARKKTYLCLIISASLICVHYFLLGNLAAGTLVALTVIRFIVCYYTTNKGFLLLFMLLNVVSIFLTYQSAIDLIIFTGSMIFMIGNFQKNNKLMRILMMIGTSLYLSYNIIIASPMAVVLEGLFLVSNFIGYYRHYVKIRLETQGGEPFS